MKQPVGMSRLPDASLVVVCTDGSVYVLRAQGQDINSWAEWEWVEQTPVPGTVAASRFFERTGKGRENVNG